MLKPIAQPIVGVKIPQERILYFFGGTVKNGRIVVTQKDRNWYYGGSKKGEELVYVILKETAKQYDVLSVDVSTDRVITRIHNGCKIKKSELVCVRTGGMRQDIGEPVMGMITPNKDDIVIVLRAMKQAIFNEINEQQALLDEMESVMENS